MRKINKRGFSMVEIIVVVVIIGLIAGIAAGNMTDAKNKSECELMAGEIRDFISEGSAFASKTSRSIPLTVNTATKTISCDPVAINGKNITPWPNPVTGQGYKLILQSRADDLKLYYITKTQTRQTLFNNDNLLNITLTAGANNDQLYLRPSGNPCIFNNSTEYANRMPFITVSKGKYMALIEIRGSGNVSMHIAKGAKASDGIQARRFHGIK